VLSFLLAFLSVVRVFVRSRTDTALEVLALRQQLGVLKRKRPRPRLSAPDRLFWVLLQQLWSRWAEALIIVNPDTVVGWHRAGFRLYWRWRSGERGGRPRISEEIRVLIRRLAQENPDWGAPRIHGELQKLGFVVSDRTIARYLRRILRRCDPGKKWLAFLRNHRNWGGYIQGDDANFSLFSWEAYRNFRAHTPEFSDLAALQAGNAPLAVRRAGSQAPADTRNGESVSGNFFKTFGVQPWVGRLMTDADDQEGTPPVAVMSYRIWRERYASDLSVAGAAYEIDGHSFTVIGVAASGFYGAKLVGAGMLDFWIPVTTIPLIDGA
jgi:hypothetical protein